MNNNELWANAANAVQKSMAAAPLKAYLEAEYQKKLEDLVKDNSDINCGMARQLRNLIKDLFKEGIDTTN